MNLIARLKKVWFILLSKLTGIFINNNGSRLIIFGARDGEYYMDNSRALFEWYIKNRPQGTYYWMTSSPTVFKYLKHHQMPVARIDSFKGIILLHKAKYAYYSNRLLDIAVHHLAVPSTLRIVFLSHGQSVKNTRLAVNAGIDKGYQQDTIKASSQMEFAVTTSPFMAQVQSKSNGLIPEMYQLTGFPRNDWMFNPPAEAYEEWKAFTGGKTFNKVVLYAPTWRRNEPKTIMFPFEDFNAVQLANYVQEQNILLLLRPHVQELTSNPKGKAVIDQLTALSSNIRLATINHFVEANFLLPFVDALISDYSSIYHDFLLLDRPMYFIPYDLPSFDQVNGFKYPYRENLPGPIINNQQEFLLELENLKNNIDYFSSQRSKLRALIYTHVDGKSCERLAKILN
jgi:CDP-glycerol glycerophosphotransferase (TagB/SpsB family)